MAMVGAAVAVLAHRASELRDDQDDRVLVVRSERGCETREPLAKRLQMVCELALRRALIDVRVPSAEREKSEPDARVARDQMRKAAGVVGESFGRGRAV